MSFLDLARRLLPDVETEAAVGRGEAAADPAVALALAVFPDATVTAVNVPAVWPPEGGWPARTRPALDVYADTAPTVPCPTCRDTVWHRAGHGWTCATCHPPVGGDLGNQSATKGRGE